MSSSNSKENSLEKTKESTSDDDSTKTKSNEAELITLPSENDQEIVQHQDVVEKTEISVNSEYITDSDEESCKIETKTKLNKRVLKKSASKLPMHRAPSMVRLNRFPSRLKFKPNKNSNVTSINENLGEMEPTCLPIENKNRKSLQKQDRNSVQSNFSSTNGNNALRGWGNRTNLFRRDGTKCRVVRYLQNYLEYKKRKYLYYICLINGQYPQLYQAKSDIGEIWRMCFNIYAEAFNLFNGYIIHLGEVHGYYYPKYNSHTRKFEWKLKDFNFYPNSLEFNFSVPSIHIADVYSDFMKFLCLENSIIREFGSCNFSSESGDARITRQFERKFKNFKRRLIVFQDKYFQDQNASQNYKRSQNWKQESGSSKSRYSISHERKIEGNYNRQMQRPLISFSDQPLEHYGDRSINDRVQQQQQQQRKQNLNFKANYHGRNIYGNRANSYS